MSRIHRVRAGASIPGFVLRIALVVVSAVASVALLPDTWFRWCPIVAAVSAALWPHLHTAWVALACFPFGLLYTEPTVWGTVLAVAATHAIHVLGGLTLAIPPLARVQLRALVPSAIRFLWIQVVAQAIVLTMLQVLPGVGAIGYAWFALVGATALLLLGLVLIRVGERRDG